MTNPFEPLRARGITDRTIATFVLTPVPGGWQYPILDEDGEVRGYRVKRGPGGQGPKYRWLQTPSPCTDALYNPTGIKHGRPVLLLAGEPDVWLAHTLGHPAVSLLTGEGGRVPDPAVAVLVRRAPSCVVVIYDRDATGERGAVNAVRALCQVGLRAYALRLPETLPEHGDFTDLYAAAGQDPEAFTQALMALPRVTIPPVVAPAPLPFRPRTRPAGALSPIETFNADNPIEDVVGTVVMLRPRSGGRYLDGRCPFHDDGTPSLWVCPETGRYGCFGCDARGDAFDFAHRRAEVRR